MPPRKRRTDADQKLHAVPPLEEPLGKEPAHPKSRPGRRPENARLSESDRPAGAPTVRKFRVEGKMLDLIEGRLSVDDMDDQELARMQFRDKNGGFSGRPPSTLPREVVNRIRAELIRRGNNILSEAFQDSMNVLTEIACFGENDAVRLRAINMILERVVGKVPDKIELGTPDKPFEVLINRVTRTARKSDDPE